MPSGIIGPGGVNLTSLFGSILDGNGDALNIRADGTSTLRALGGTIEIRTELGKGTTFVLEFPSTDARPMPAAVAG